MKRNVLKSQLLAGVLSLVGVFSASALDVVSGDKIAFGGDEILFPVGEPNSWTTEPSISKLMAVSAQAGIEFRPVFQDNMVLQRAIPGYIDSAWVSGTGGTPGSTVTATIGGKSGTGVVAADGTWCAEIAGLTANATGQTLSATDGATTISIGNVRIGDVYIVNGHSMIGPGLGGGATRFATEFASVKPNVTSYAGGKWNVKATADSCSSELGGLSSYFALELARAVGNTVPIGIVRAAQSSATCGTYDPGSKNFEAELRPHTYTRICGVMLENWDRTSGAGTTLKNHIAKVRQQWGYNIWYGQNQTPGYRMTFPDFPWGGLYNLASQDHNGGYQGNSYEDDRAGELVNLKGAVAKYVVAVVHDGGSMADGSDVHSADRWLPAKQIARQFATKIHNRNIGDVAPAIWQSVTREGDMLRVSFDTVGAGLTAGYHLYSDIGKSATATTDAVHGFAVAGSDKRYFWADAKIDGATVLVSSPNVPEPQYVRYGDWFGPCDGSANLYYKVRNASGAATTELLPVAPIRSGAATITTTAGNFYSTRQTASGTWTVSGTTGSCGQLTIADGATLTGSSAAASKYTATNVKADGSFTIRNATLVVNQRSPEFGKASGTVTVDGGAIACVTPKHGSSLALLRHHTADNGKTGLAYDPWGSRFQARYEAASQRYVFQNGGSLPDTDFFAGNCNKVNVTIKNGTSTFGGLEIGTSQAFYTHEILIDNATLKVTGAFLVDDVNQSSHASGSITLTKTGRLVTKNFYLPVGDCKIGTTPTTTAEKLNVAVPEDGWTASSPAIKVTGDAFIGDDVDLVLDLAAYQPVGSAGTVTDYPVLTCAGSFDFATTKWIDASAASAFASRATLANVPDGCTAAVVVDAAQKRIVLRVTSTKSETGKILVNAPTVAAKTYTGKTLTADVAPTAQYAVTKNAGGTNVGTYDVELTLTDTAKYAWSDDANSATKTLKFAITKATNGWTTKPSLSKTTWTQGACDATVNLGAAQFGDVQATCRTTADLAALGVGTHDVVFSVAETANYGALSETVVVRVIEKSNREDGRQSDVSAASYAWKGGDGAWNDDAKWTASASALCGIPDHAEYATAVFGSAVASSPATVTVGGAYAVTALTVSGGQEVTLAGSSAAACRVAVQGAQTVIAAPLTLKDVTLDCAAKGLRISSTLGLKGSATVKGAVSFGTKPTLAVTLGANASKTAAPFAFTGSLALPNDLVLDVDASALPQASAVGSWPLCSASTLTGNAYQIFANSDFARVPTECRPSFRIEGNVLWLDITENRMYQTAQFKAVFKDWDGTVLYAQQIEENATPAKPADPVRSGYTFTGWSPSDLTCRADTVFTAQYQKEGGEDPEIGDTLAVPAEGLTLSGGTYLCQNMTFAGTAANPAVLTLAGCAQLSFGKPSNVQDSIVPNNGSKPGAIVVTGGSSLSSLTDRRFFYNTTDPQYVSFEVSGAGSKVDINQFGFGQYAPKTIVVKDGGTMMIHNHCLFSAVADSTLTVANGSFTANGGSSGTLGGSAARPRYAVSGANGKISAKVLEFNASGLTLAFGVPAGNWTAAPIAATATGVIADGATVGIDVSALGLADGASATIPLVTAEGGLTVTPAMLTLVVTDGCTGTLSADAKTLSVKVTKTGGEPPVEPDPPSHEEHIPDAFAANSIVCIGDSLTSWGDDYVNGVSPSKASDNYMPTILKGYGKNIQKNYPFYLADRVGSPYTVLNMSKAGGVTDSIMSWFGEKSLVTVSNLAFTAGQATIAFSDLDARGNHNLSVGNPTEVVDYRCHNRKGGEFPDLTMTDRVDEDLGGDASVAVNKLLGEMHGFGRVLLGEHSVTRMGDCSQPLTIPIGTRFTPDSAYMFRNSIHVIFTGTNDQAGRLKDVADVIKDYVDTLPNARYIVITSHYSVNLSQHPEPYYQQLFGDHYIALYDELSTNGVKRAIKLGLADPSTADDQWINVLTKGASNPHFKDVGCKVLADVVYEKLQNLGYLEKTEPVVEPEKNSWTTEPSVSKTVWTEGETAGTLSFGKAKSGGTVTCNYTQDQVNALAKGTYTVTFTVAATAEWTGLEKSISITVNEKQADPEPPTMEGRAISDVSAHGTTVTFDLGAAANDVALWIAGGASDRGEDFDDWSGAGEAKFVKIVARGTAVSRESVDLAALGLGNAKIVRVFTRPAYDATLTGLVGSRSAAGVGSYIDTLDTPNLTDRLVADVTAPRLSGGEYETIFSARKDNASGDRTMTAFIKHNQGNSTFRIDYGAYNGTSAYKCESSAYTAAGARYEVTLDANQASVSPDLLAETMVKGVAETADAGGTLLLFATRAQTASGVVANHLGKFTLHSFKWYSSNGTLKHDYIPVRVANGVKTLYDRKLGVLLAPSKAGAAEDFGGEDATPVTGALTFSEAVTQAEPPVVEPEENEWTTEPSLSATSWTEGDAVTINMGAAKYGTVTCNYTQEALNALKKGTYTVKFTVAATDAYTGLEKSVEVTVSEKQGGGDEPSSGSVTLTCSNYKGTETLANFPMLVRLSEESIPGFSYDGLDSSLIMFKDALGNELPCDVDTWNPDGESLVWVKVPSLTSSAQVVFAWGKASGANSGDTWTAYDGVWHFNESSGTTFADSKGTYGDASVAEPGTDTHVTCTIGPQKLGNGIALKNDGEKREGNMLTTESRTLSGAITVSGWYQVSKLRDSTSDTYPNLIRGGAWQGGGFYLQCGTTGDSKVFTLVANSNQVNYNQNPETVLGGGLHHVAVTVGPDGSKLYIDGIQKCSSASARLSSWTGRFSLLASVRSASADEVRVQPTVASPDWITADYQQQASADGRLYATSEEPPVVEQKENTWTSEPSLSKTSWTEGETAGILDFGAAEYGTVTCNYTQEALNALKKGTYTVTFTVAETAEWTGLSKSVEVTVAEKKVSLGAAEWTAYMQGVDTPEELAAVKAAVAGKPKVKIAFANSSTDGSHGTPHDTFEQNEMYSQAQYFGLDIEIIRVQPADPASGRTMGVVYQEAVDSADIVCDFSSYWDDEEGTVHDGNARELAAQVIAANPNKLFILPYGEISPTPPTGTSLQSMALKRDGTGFRNLVTTSPIGPTTGGKLTYVARRTADDTETITFVIPSGWAGSTGDTCRSASMATVLAAWIWAARGDSPTAATIVKMLSDASALPEVSEVTGFTAEHLATLKSNLATYTATDELGRSKLIYDKPVNMANLLALIPDSKPTLEPSAGIASVEVKASDAESAKAQVVFNPPEGTDVAPADYAAYFKLTATDVGNGSWQVQAELDEAVVRPVLAEKEDAAAFEIGDAGGVIRVGNVKPGLYYGYVTAESIQGLTAAKPVMQAEPAKSSATLTLTLPKPTDPTGFYRIVVRERR